MPYTHQCIKLIDFVVKMVKMGISSGVTNSVFMLMSLALACIQTTRSKYFQLFGGAFLKNVLKKRIICFDSV